MEAVYENWFDYEVNGKVPFSLIESQFNEEYDNFIKMMNAIDVCNESGVVTITLNENAITDKIKELWHKFKLWVTGLVNKIKSAISGLKSKIEFYKNAINSMSKIDWVKLGQDYDKAYVDFWSSQKDVIDVEFTITEAAISGSEKYIGLETVGKVMISDADKVIKYIEEEKFPKVEDTIAELMGKLAKAHDPESSKELLDVVSKAKAEIDNDEDNTPTQITASFESKFSNDPEKYSEYLVEHLEDLDKAEKKYYEMIAKTKARIFAADWAFISKVDENTDRIVAGLFEMFTKYYRKKLTVYEKLVSICHRDGNISGKNLAFNLKKKKSENFEEK